MALLCYFLFSRIVRWRRYEVVYRLFDFDRSFHKKIFNTRSSKDTILDTTSASLRSAYPWLFFLSVYSFLVSLLSSLFQASSMLRAISLLYISMPWLTPYMAFYVFVPLDISLVLPCESWILLHTWILSPICHSITRSVHHPISPR